MLLFVGRIKEGWFGHLIGMPPGSSGHTQLGGVLVLNQELTGGIIYPIKEELESVVVERDV